MLLTDIFILEKLHYTMLVRRGVGLTIVVSVPIVLFTFLIMTDVIDVNVFGETFFTGLEETTELGIQMKTGIEEKIDKIFLP